MALSKGKMAISILLKTFLFGAMLWIQFDVFDCCFLLLSRRGLFRGWHRLRFAVETDRNDPKQPDRFLCFYCSDDLELNPEHINYGQEDLYCCRCFTKIAGRGKGREPEAEPAS